VKKYLAVVSVLAIGIAMVAAVATSHAATTTSTPAAEKTAVVDTDNVNVQQGDQTTPDAVGAKAVESGETAGAPADAEAASGSAVEEPGDQNLPGGGHQDAAGANVNHQFDGIE